MRKGLGKLAKLGKLGKTGEHYREIISLCEASGVDELPGSKQHVLRTRCLISVSKGSRMRIIITLPKKSGEDFSYLFSTQVTHNTFR